MRIESVAAQPDRAGRHLVRFEDGKVMRLYPQTVEDFGLYPGLELDGEKLELLHQEAGRMSAKMRAVRIISASNVSKRDLRERLVRKGETPEQAEEAVAWMEELDLVDDEKTARLLVERCIARGYGLERAKQTLYEKRIPKSLWDQALEDYPHQMEYIKAYIRPRLSEIQEDRGLKRVVDALLRRGHSYGRIRKALEELGEEPDEYPED